MRGQKRTDFLVWLTGQDPLVLRAFVDGWHRRYLNRPASERELSAHTARLRQGAGWDAIQAAILASSEYLALQRVRYRNCK